MQHSGRNTPRWRRTLPAAIVTALLGSLLLAACDQADSPAPAEQDSVAAVENPAATARAEMAETDTSTSEAGENIYTQGETGPDGLHSGIDQSGFDTSVDPAENFYQYVNGTWLEQTEIPADKSNYGSFTKLADEAEEAQRNIILEASEGNPAKGSPEQKIGDAYTAYMNQDLANERGIEPIQAELDMIDGIESTEDLYRVMAELGKSFVDAPFGMGIFSDRKDPNTNVVYVSESGLSLPDRDYYLEDDEQFATGRELLKTYISTVFELAGMDNVDSRADALVALETRLAEHHWPREDNRDPNKTYNPNSYEELKALAPAIDWDTFHSASGVEPQPKYIVAQPSYFEALDDVLQETDLSTWKDYLRLKTLQTFDSILSDDFFQAGFEFQQKGLSGVEQPRDLWKRAVSHINGGMGELLGQIYVKKHFRPEAKARMEEMVDNLKRAYRDSINELEWMGEDTKKQALDKLSKFRTKIGYPDEWKDYSSLDIVADDRVANTRAMRLWAYNREIDKLGKPVNKDEWFMTPQTVNAYYNPVWNEIVFPAAILQPPFFNVEAESAVNYGGIGAVIGHEIGHGFDDQGRKSDGDGNLRDWWTAEDNEKFEQRKQMLARQYNEYEVIDGLTINGEFTSGENIGDLGGLSIAHKAYELSQNGGDGPVIDGFTSDQRVLMGWAQVWRRLYRDEELKQRLTTDPHSPSSARTNVVVKNIPVFYEAFDVQEGDAMYLPPDERVKIW